MACQLARVAHMNDATTLAPTCCGNATQLLRERNRVPGNAGPRRAQQQEPEVGAFYWTALAPDIVNPPLVMGGGPFQGVVPRLS